MLSSMDEHSDEEWLNEEGQPGNDVPPSQERVDAALVDTLRKDIIRFAQTAFDVHRASDAEMLAALRGACAYWELRAAGEPDNA